LKDAAVGLEEYLTLGSGIGGHLKDDPRDFTVLEVTDDGVTLTLDGDLQGDMTSGDYTHFTLVKENWETMRAVGEIAKSLGVSRNRFAFAGTKDKRAVTAQRVSAYRIPVERLRVVRIKDLALKDYSYSDESLGLGCLGGNRFRVVVRGVSGDAKERVESTALELAGGFPNYYGHQRFGEQRPVTHLVGRLILGGDFEAAVMSYLAATFEGEGPELTAMRRTLMESRDYDLALRSFPRNLGYERAMLAHLSANPGDYKGALRQLPRNLQTMFVHAYQSHVFNRALSECMRRSLPVESLPLAGVEVEADDISLRIMEGDGVRREDFAVKGMEELKSRGVQRICYAEARNLRWDVSGDTATFDFTLGAGSYATVLLREFMKN